MSDAGGLAYTLAEFHGGPHDGDMRVLYGAPGEWHVMMPDRPPRCLDGEATPLRIRTGVYRRSGDAAFHVTAELIARHPDHVVEMVERGALPCRYDWIGEP